MAGFKFTVNQGRCCREMYPLLPNVEMWFSINAVAERIEFSVAQLRSKQWASTALTMDRFDDQFPKVR